jgi:DNA-binding PadR family transcriptional regulator
MARRPYSQDAELLDLVLGLIPEDGSTVRWNEIERHLPPQFHGYKISPQTISRTLKRLEQNGEAAHEKGVGWRRSFLRGSEYAKSIRNEKGGVSVDFRNWADFWGSRDAKHAKAEDKTEVILASKITEATRVLFFRYIEMLRALVKLKSAAAADEVIDLFFRREANHLLAETARQIWTERGKLHLKDVGLLIDYLGAMSGLGESWPYKESTTRGLVHKTEDYKGYWEAVGS